MLLLLLLVAVVVVCLQQTSPMRTPWLDTAAQARKALPRSCTGTSLGDRFLRGSALPTVAASWPTCSGSQLALARSPRCGTWIAGWHARMCMRKTGLREKANVALHDLGP